ncbi:MAG: T9SS type A sorting domain-containing protein [Bacteroidota bacterium]|nr:T9SS type A sorting domain-containing protein [Bacteroidota bacterium]MDP4192579.1 T9SS type A sorting domain-containing protein [Bacteroidota bacterium]
MIPTTGTFKILVVYCKFADDNFDFSPFTDLWPSTLNTLPEWTSKTISKAVMSKYPDPSISGYFSEMSGGKLNMIGDVCPVLYIPKHEESYYYNSNGKNVSFLAKEVLDGIDPYVNFSDYDNNKDGIVDMIAICFRSVKDFGKLDYRWGRYQGTASMTGSYTKFDNSDTDALSGSSELVKDGVRIRAGFGGSGTIQNNIYDPEGQLPIINHEIGHYFFGYAFNGNLHLDGIHHHGLMDTNGGGGVMNAYERELLGWVTPKVISTDQKDIIIKDALLDKDIYKIHSSRGDYYIENHEGKSYYESSWKYYNGGPLMSPGKGILVTKINKNSSSKFVDIKSAAGNWNWKCKDGYYLFPFEKESSNPTGGYDELNLTGVQTTSGIKSHPDYLGSQKDYFTLGYNQVFSSWSNPCVDNDAIFTMELKEMQQMDIKLDFYFLNILSGSPSKPQDLSISKGKNNHPVLSWKSNSETDVTLGGSYRIYKSYKDDTSSASYHLIGTVNHDPATSSQTFEDVSEDLNLGANSTTGTSKFYYKISVIDRSMLESVMSEAVVLEDSSSSHQISLEGDRSVIKTNKLLNNYPNPFNPSTQITYQLSRGGYVKLEVFDILGNKVAELVNEEQKEGSHIVNFDGSSNPSGIYIYRIQCEGYQESKKMTLLR